jgi:predicted dehydrogenase
MKKLKVGVIGLGVGEQHVLSYQSHPDCEVVALCDFSKEKRAEIQKKFPQIKLFENADALLEDPEIGVVSIASYDNAHADQILRALKNKKHVFVEKPVCLSEGEARRIRRELTKNPDLKLSSNLILRRSPRFQRLKRQISSGELGKIYYAEGDYLYGRLHKITDGWRGKIGYYSVTYGGGIHIIDLLLWLTGDEVIEVAAYGNQIPSKGSQFKYNDMVVCILKFKSGIIGKMSVNFGCIHPHYHALSVFGTKGTFQNGPDKALLYKQREAPAQKVSEAYPGVKKGALIPGFVNLILKGTPAEVSTDDVFKSMSVCFAIEKAMQQGRPVKVKYL